MRKYSSIFLLILFLIFIQTFILYYYSYTPPYLNDHIAYITYYLDYIHIPLSSGELRYIPGFPAMITILSKITSLPPREIQFLPITTPIFILASYILSRKLIKSPLYSLFLAYLMYVGFGYPYYSVWPHGLGFLLFSLFLYGYINLLQSEKWIKWVIILLLIFTATNFYSYRAEAWMIIFLIGYNLLSWGFIIVKKKKITDLLKHLKITGILIPISVIIIFLLFNKIVYDKINLVGMTSFIESLKLFWYKYLTKNQVNSYLYLYRPIPFPILKYLNIFYLIAILMPIGLLTIKKIKRFVRDKKITFNRYTLLLFSMLLPVFVDTIIYGMMGSIFFSYILYIYPIIAFVSIKKLTHHLHNFYPLVMAVLVTVIFCLTWYVGHLPDGQIVDSTSRYAEIKPSANWFFSERDDSKLVIADHYTGGRYSIVGADKGIYFMRDKNYTLYSINTYKKLVDNKEISNEDFTNNYVIINIVYSNKKTWAGGWMDFEPLSKHLNKIDNNTNIDKIYDDRMVCIFTG